MAAYLAQMIGFIVEFSFLPKGPDDMQPAVGQTTIGVTLAHATLDESSEIGCCPGRSAGGTLSELLGRSTIIAITGPSKLDVAGVAAGDSDGGRAGDGR